LIRTLTLDNGVEFAQHQAIAQALNIDIFFCEPYCSWQKGSVENGNLQLREELPRDVRLNQFTQRRINRIVDRINHRPLKCLNFKHRQKYFKRLSHKLIIFTRRLKLIFFMRLLYKKFN